MDPVEWRAISKFWNGGAAATKLGDGHNDPEPSELLYPASSAACPHATGQLLPAQLGCSEPLGSNASSTQV